MTDRGLVSQIIVHVHTINLYYLIYNILSLNDLFKPHALHASSYLLKSRATYLFPDMKNWGETDTLSTIQRVESSPPMTSCSLCGALPFDVNLCRNRKQHEENNIIRGSLFGESGVFPTLLSPD